MYPTVKNDPFGGLGINLSNTVDVEKIRAAIVSYWGFNTSPGLTEDSVGSVSLTNVGGMFQNVADEPEGDASARYNGTSYFTVGDLAQFQPNQNFSIAIWVRLRNPPDVYFPVAKDDFSAPSRGWGIFTQTPGGWHFGFVLGTGNEAIDVESTGVIILPNVWYHVVGTHDLSNKRVTLYVDGVQLASGTYSFDVAANSEPMYIGRETAGVLMRINARTDQCIFFNKVLTPAEVAFVKNNPDGLL